MTSETRLISIIGIPAAASFQSLGIAHADSFGIAERLGPVTKGSGFAMDGWFIWCGSVIKVGNAYHMFVARWPEATKFPDGYRANLEFVRAVAPRAEGPYVFQEVALRPARGGKMGQRDGAQSRDLQGRRHLCPYYLGSEAGSRYRQIGIATSHSITGPWTRRDQPLSLGVASDANNPAACFEPDGSVKLVWSTTDLRICISTARSFEGLQ